MPKIRTNTLEGIVPFPEIFIGPCTITLKVDDVCTVDRGVLKMMGTLSTSGKSFHVSRVAGNKFGYYSLSPLAIFHNSGCNLALQHGILRGLKPEAREEYGKDRVPVDPNVPQFGAPQRKGK